VAEDVEVGAGSIEWDEDLPEEDGIYTYVIEAEHSDDPAPVYPCEDQDKSSMLTISGLGVSDEAYLARESGGLDPYRLAARVHYTLGRPACSGAVRIRAFDRQAQEAEIISPVGGVVDAVECTQGSHTVEVAVEHTEQLIGRISFCVEALEHVADATQNRDGAAKPAVPRGCSFTWWPPAETCDGPGEALFYLTRLNIQAHQPHLLGDPDYVGQYAVGTCAATPADIAFWVRRSAVFTYCGHGEATFLDLDDTTYDLDDLASADLSSMLFVMWLHCHSATPNNGYNFVDVSRARGAECAVGWEDFVRNGCWPLFCDDFWSRTCRLDQDVDSALEDAAWQTWVTLGSWLTEGLFDYRCEGNVQLTPARYGH
ncbi:MAG: hypothetical protein AB7Y46_17310, partial [Armatimonadota bacterium]